MTDSHNEVMRKCQTVQGLMEEWERNPPRPLAYLDASMFRHISMRNFSTYIKLGQDDRFTYTVVSSMNDGFVFDNEDIARQPVIGMLPVMSVGLHDLEGTNLKQAHRVCIRKEYASLGVPTRWYKLYTAKFGSLASEFRYLHGEKALTWADLPGLHE
jgi:hypothetical protein